MKTPGWFLVCLAQEAKILFFAIISPLLIVQVQICVSVKLNAVLRRPGRGAVNTIRQARKLFMKSAAFSCWSTYSIWVTGMYCTS